MNTCDTYGGLLSTNDLMERLRKNACTLSHYKKEEFSNAVLLFENEIKRQLQIKYYIKEWVEYYNYILCWYGNKKAREIWISIDNSIDLLRHFGYIVSIDYSVPFFVEEVGYIKPINKCTFNGIPIQIWAPEQGITRKGLLLR